MKPRQKTGPGGFTLIEFFIIVAVMAVLTAIYLPQLARPHRHRHPPNCVNQLKQVGLSFRQWALDYGDKNPMRVSVTNGGTMEWVETGVVYPHFLVMSNELNTPRILFCPQDKSHQATSSFTTNFNDVNVSYFVGLDAVDTEPQMFLVGDSNLQIGNKPVRRGILNLGTNAPVGWTRSRHGPQGNVALADGSVQSFSSARLREALSNSGDQTNRLAIP